MNSFINVLTLFVTFPILALAIFIGFDIPFDSLGITGSEIPYRFELFAGLGFILFIIQLRRTTRRWMALSMVTKLNRFQWNQPVSSSRKKRIATYNLIEVVIMSFLSVGLYVVTKETIIPAIVFLLFALDSLIFTIYGGNKYRVGLSKKAILVADREIILIYFTGLRKVAIQQQTVYFDYINNLQLTFPLDCIEIENQPAFFDALHEVIDKDRVFFSNIQQTI
ncbi:MAG: hypothetical protein K9G36_04240 [Crocinitomicaceae bacterium]|nr:hypothetical protein [Crocinitomicaceae bacterium]MCF8411645.1 hypothetical protein [Crocinitomicaceae bacterium]MCF8444713.1 hypothetical protein [Crocinitomicaceae bacterium]